MSATSSTTQQTVKTQADMAMEILERIPHLKDTINPERLAYLLVHAAGANLTALMRRTCPKGNDKPEISVERLCALINSESIDMEKFAKYVRVEWSYWNPLLGMLSWEVKRKPLLGSEREFTIREIIEKCKLG